MLERWLIGIVKDINKRTGQPARTAQVATYIPRHERTIRTWLVDLERRGRVQRVGQRGGWLPA